jgi:hypothetical protein
MRTICTVVGVAAAFLLAAAQASAAAPASGALDAASAPVSDNELEGMRGGEATMPAGMGMVLTSQSATDGYNTVAAGGNVDSGDINLGQDAFKDFAGIGNFVINTGHNNNLLGSLSVAINMMQTAAAGNSVQ